MSEARSSNSRTKTFVAKLHPLAVKLNLKTHLSKITLGSLLSGDTCAPISLSDFEKYLSFVEYSVENLHFLVWFQDYRKRYLSTTRGSQASLLANESPLHNSTFPTSRDEAAFSIECSRAVATFLTPGCNKELLLDARLRDGVILRLSSSCHPNVFQPVYDEVYTMLDETSLPRFLSAASANINLPKQIYWYSIGASILLVGILTALILIMLVPIPPQVNRTWRIIPVLLITLGGGTCYSAWRGYCGRLFSRSSIQVRVWEMQEMDSEAQIFVDGVVNGISPYQQSTIPMEDVKVDPTSVDVATIAPFALEPMSTDTIPSYQTTTPIVGEESTARYPYRRPPLFGPESIILDPRILATHRQSMFAVYRFGLYLLLISSAILFPLPSR